jgi:hypothetical protein
VASQDLSQLKGAARAHWIAVRASLSGCFLLVVVACAAAPAEMSTATDVAARLRTAGLPAQATGETVRPMFGAASGELVRVDGVAVQVYAFPNTGAAKQGIEAARGNPAVEWAAKPHFVRSGNLVLTVVTDDDPAAASIVAALQ